MATTPGGLPPVYPVNDAVVGFHYWYIRGPSDGVRLGKIISNGHDRLFNQAVLCRATYVDGRFVSQMRNDTLEKGHRVYPAEDFDGTFIPSTFALAMHTAKPKAEVAVPPASVDCEIERAQELLRDYLGDRYSRATNTIGTRSMVVDELDRLIEEVRVRDAKLPRVQLYPAPGPDQLPRIFDISYVNQDVPPAGVPFKTVRDILPPSLRDFLDARQAVDPMEVTLREAVEPLRLDDLTYTDDTDY